MDYGGYGRALLRRTHSKVKLGSFLLLHLLLTLDTLQIWERGCSMANIKLYSIQYLVLSAA